MARPTRGRLVLLGCIAALLTNLPPLHAQDLNTPSFGFWMGGAWVPAGLDPSRCSEARSGGGMPNLGAFLVVPVGPIGLEGRVGGYMGGRDYICAVLLVEPAARIERISALDPGGFAAVDLRVRWLPLSGGPLLLAVGGGWAGASKDIPYLTSGLGLRMPGVGTRAGIDFDVTIYRVPWIERTFEVIGVEEMETSRRTLDEWTPALGVRLSVEIPQR